MKLTAQCKAKFSDNIQDLSDRGRRLVLESIECGVTSMRAHVEVDKFVGFACLDVALQLKQEFRGICDVQIAVFAQEPLFDDPSHEDPGTNYELLVEAMGRMGVDVVGSAPYVEKSSDHSKRNIFLILDLADRFNYHVDFHLDYNLDPQTTPLVHHLIDSLRMRHWPSQRRITIGHATRLMLFDDLQWKSLSSALAELPVTLVGLPNSDLYMQGGKYPSSTLNVPRLARKFQLEVAMSVNNVENAFTPQGSLDPLSLTTLGVAIFQSATDEDLRALMRSVSLSSKRAIGQRSAPNIDLFPSIGDPSDFVILHGTQSLHQAVLNPSYDRTTIKTSRVVARRQTTRWIASRNPT